MVLALLKLVLHQAVWLPPELLVEEQSRLLPQPRRARYHTKTVLHHTTGPRMKQLVGFRAAAGDPSPMCKTLQAAARLWPAARKSPAPYSWTPWGFPGVGQHFCSHWELDFQGHTRWEEHHFHNQRC